jgi:hypothetical protein
VERLLELFFPLKPKNYNYERCETFSCEDIFQEHNKTGLELEFLTTECVLE